MRNYNRNTKRMKHFLLSIFNENFVSEAATESSSGKKLLKSRQNPWKISVKKFIFSKVSGCKPATLLKINSFTFIFHGFCIDLKSFAVAFKTFQNTYFWEHLSMAVSVCVETVLSKLVRLLFKDVLLRNDNRK